MSSGTSSVATPRALRPRPGEDTRAWTEAVFAAGDYAGAAMYGDTATWEHHAALAMLRGDAAAFAALADCHGAPARLHAAAARWIHGDTARARRELAGIDLEHARNLARLLDRPRIRVLAQLPWVAGATTDLAGGARHDHQFELRTIGHTGADVRDRPYASAQRFVDDGFAPDFYVAAMVEWQHVPPDLQALACPLFGHVADHDLHVQTIRPWLDLFDELCVTDRTEWLDVQGLGRGTVSSFAKVFGLPRDLPPIPHGDRHLDFFVSGTMLDPYHPDKARVLHELLAMPGIDLRVVRGFTGAMAFHALLAASKASFTFVRRPGALPTRGLESLALGCAVALQRESVMSLWVGEREGVATWSAERGELAAAVRRILDHWDHFGPAAQRGAAIVREHFALPVVASQYLRFLTFRAAAPRAARRIADTGSWCQKRLCVSRAWLPDDPAVRRRTMQANFRHVGAAFARSPGPAALVDMARELLCEFAFYDGKGQADVAERAYLADAIGLLEKCCRRWPDHLAARFVLVRTLWHHGDARQRLHALQLASDTLEVDPARWQIAPHDDVMPFDFHADTFHHRAYFDLVARAEKGEPVPALELARPILASLAGYVARKTGKVALHELAVRHDPAFARYRLDLATALLRRGGGDERRRAHALLVELADGSAEFHAATRLLRCELGENAARAAVGDASWRAVERLDVDAIDASRSVAQLFAVERRAPKTAANARLALPSAARGVHVAVLVPWPGTDAELADLLTELEAQTCAASCEVVVAAPAPARVAAGTLAAATAFADVRLVAVDEHAPFAARLNACVRAATAPLLTIALAGDRLRPDALALLRRALDDAPDAAAAFASEGWTDGTPARFLPSACLGFQCPPPAAHLRLPATNGIGGHAMWRRTLHDVHGAFAAELGPAAEYGFWLRALAGADVRHLPELLSTSPLRAPWRAHRDPAVDLAAVARARAALGAGTGTGASTGASASAAVVPFRPHRPLPAALLAPGIAQEAESFTRLGVLTPAQCRDVVNLESFLGTALLHGDVATATCLLRAAIEHVPDLLTPRLGLASLLDATGQSGARDVLLAARACEPYRTIVTRRLAELGVGVAGHAREPKPCPR